MKMKKMTERIFKPSKEFMEQTNVKKRMQKHGIKKNQRIGDLLEGNAIAYPESDAIIFNGKVITYNELNNQVNQFAAGLLKLGINGGDKVAVWLPNCIEWSAAWFAITRIGAVVVPIDVWYKPIEAEYILNHAEVVAVIITAKFGKRNFVNELNNLRQKLHHLKYTIVVNGDENSGYPFKKILALGADWDTNRLYTEQIKSVHPDNVAFILYTSGTTGKPKGAMLTHANIIQNSKDAAEILKITNKDKFLIPVPFSHCFGNVLSITLATTKGASMVPMTKFDPEEALKLIEKEKCTICHGVPTMFIREIEVLRRKSYDTSSLRTGIIAGAPCPEELIRNIIEIIGCNICIGYGLTEASPLITMTRLDDSLKRRVETVGRAIPNVEVRIVDENHNEVSCREIGELCCRGYNVMAGYYKQQEETKNAIDEEGWLYTGDLAVMDEYGYCKIVGRKKEMAIVGGVNVYPKEIEEYLIIHPKIREAYVVGVPDRDLGEVVAAVIVPKKGKKLNSQEIVDFCYNKIASPKVPKYVDIVDNIPVSGRGKVQKLKIQDMLKKKISAGKLNKITPTTIEVEKKDIDVLLEEKRVFIPSQELVKQSNVKRWMDEHRIKDYEELLEKAKDIEWFWDEAAKEVVEWYEPYKKVLEWTAPFAKWFVGAKYNIAHDALDRHANSWRKNKVAYIFEGEPGDGRKLTYGELYIEVNKLANALKTLGVKKGDRVGIYMPMIPELPIAMLACAKIGAIHTVVFSGFSAIAFRERVNDCKVKVVITCDGFYRRDKIVPLKSMADDALQDAPSVENVIVYKRTGGDIQWTPKRDHWWHDLTQAQSSKCDTEILDANDILYILYTSGTTGKAKGVIHAHGGYAVGTALTLKWVFDLKDKDVWWCAADIGWVTGHSYIVYAPLILGATSVIYEGAPDYPKPDRWWSIIERNHVTVLYTSPTSIRLFMRYGEHWPKKHDLSSLRLLGSVGEPINPEAWMWYYKNIGQERCQIMDTWWQTETGSFCISPLPITPLRPGYATKPLPGFSADVRNEEGKPVRGAGGNLVLLTPWPAMLRGIYKDPERYKEIYWSKYPDGYLTGDIARIDADGYFWIPGRGDDVLKVSGHRLGQSEIESALVSHIKVSEAAVIGKPHELKGESIVAFVVLKKGVEPNDLLRDELRDHVMKELGKIAKPDEVWFVNDVPKTRSGKIMRRVVRDKVIGNPIGDISTLANPEAVEEIGMAR